MATVSWEKLLYTAKKEENGKSKYEQQLFAYVRTLDRRNKNVDARIILEELEETLRMSLKRTELFNGKHIYFTELELHILNSIAVQYFYIERIKECIIQLDFLRRSVEKRVARGENLNSLLITVLNNMSAALISKGDVLSARIVAEKGIALCINAGYMPPLVSLYRNLLKCLLLGNNQADALLVSEKLVMFEEILSNRELTKPEDIMQQPYLIAE